MKYTEKQFKLMGELVVLADNLDYIKLSELVKNAKKLNGFI